MEAENYPMDESLIAILGEIKTAQLQLVKQSDELTATFRGALVLFIRQHHLEGNWQVAENGRELVKQEAVPVPVPPA